MGGTQYGEPVLKRLSDLRQYVVVNVDFEPENLALLQLGLGIGVVASHLTVLKAAWRDFYLKGEA
jgi:predicted nucleotidyltransferase